MSKLKALGFVVVASAAPDRDAYVRTPRSVVCSHRTRSMRSRGEPALAGDPVVLSDGLSPIAAETHFERVWSGLARHLTTLGTLGVPVAVRNGASPSPIRSARRCASLVVHLIGERPGLGAADSLGCYLTWKPSADDRRDRKCVSNIRPAGLDPAEAGATIAGVCRRIFECGSSGTDLVL